LHNNSNVAGTYSKISFSYGDLAINGYATIGAQRNSFDSTAGDIILQTRYPAGGSNFFITKLRLEHKGNLILGRDITAAGTNAEATLVIKTHVPPGSSPTDCFQLYSADIVAGNAAPHLRTENGDIVRLYRVGGWGLPTGSFTRTTFDTTTVTLQQLAERVAALIQDLRDNHQLLKA
jgi:hypothetical protein